MEKLIELFEMANEAFLVHDIDLFKMKVSERTLCGGLMHFLYEQICKSVYSDYFVDVEYNRNVNGTIKTCVQTAKGDQEKIITINCDLIVHSRGHKVEQDNLIAIEMKKSSARKKDKQSDRDRLRALTKDSFNNEWSFDGITLPEHVCRYILGIYYEINFKKNEILIEYFHKGEKIRNAVIELY